LTNGSSEYFQGFIFGDGAARLRSLERSSCGEGHIKRAKNSFRWGDKRGEMSGKRGQGFQFANVVFRELAKFFAADLAVGQVVFKESFDADHAHISLSNS
jgi:hypothetical protein